MVPLIGEEQAHDIYNHPQVISFERNIFYHLLQELFYSNFATGAQEWSAIVCKCVVHNAALCADLELSLRRADQFFCSRFFDINTKSFTAVTCQHSIFQNHSHNDSEVVDSVVTEFLVLTVTYYLHCITMLS